jgi:adenylate cyclase
MTKKLRLITGIILFSFLVCHLINLSFGLVSLTALDDSREWFLFFWSTTAGIVLLVGSMMTHLVLGLLSLYQRNTLKMPVSSLVQLVLGLLIFPLLFGHLLSTVIGPMMTAERQSYFSILTLFWVLDPVTGLKQAVVTMIVWIHGCMGLVIWMRIQTWWSKVAGFVYPFVVAIPLLALLGMVEAGKQVIELNKNPQNTELALEMLIPSDRFYNTLATLLNIGLAVYFFAVLLVLVARYIRVRKGGQRLSVSFTDGTKLELSTGLNLLEISRMNNRPHASLCGGKARCGTCRVRIHEGFDILPEPSSFEQRTLERIGADADTRLACQVVPGSGAITIEPLVVSYIEPRDLHHSQPGDQKTEAVEVPVK